MENEMLNPNEMRDRNVSIFKDRMSGKTLQSIADKHGISQFRVSQIVRKFERKALGFDGHTSALKKQVWELQKELYALRDEVVNLNIKSGDEENKTPVSGLELSIRSERALTQHGFKTVGMVAATPDYVLRRIPNLGAKSLHEIRALVPYRGDAHNA